ncbi:MAG: hypothetical protein ACC655_07530 [Rhodothermia bacterium]
MNTVDVGDDAKEEKDEDELIIEYLMAYWKTTRRRVDQCLHGSLPKPALRK